MRTFGAEIKALEPGLCVITARIPARHLQQHENAHAGSTFSLTDNAAGDALVAKGRVIKSGRRLIVVGAEVFVRTKGIEALIRLLPGTMSPTT